MVVERARLVHPGAGPAAVLLQLHAVQIVREFGRPGDLQYRAEDFPDAALARRAFVREVHRLTRRGYQPGLHDQALVDAIRRDGDDASYGVYADWLGERGDPRAELIQVQTRLEADPHDAALRAVEARLLAEYGVQWAEPQWGAQQSYRWRRGFVDRLDFACRSIGAYPWPCNHLRHGVLNRGSAPWELLRSVLRHPSGGLLRWVTETRGSTAPGLPAHVRYRVEFDAAAGWRDVEVRLLAEEERGEAPGA